MALLFGTYAQDDNGRTYMARYGTDFVTVRMSIDALARFGEEACKHMACRKFDRREFDGDMEVSVEVSDFR